VADVAIVAEVVDPQKSKACGGSLASFPMAREKLLLFSTIYAITPLSPALYPLGARENQAAVFGNGYSWGASANCSNLVVESE